MSLSFLPFLETARNAGTRKPTGSDMLLQGVILPLHVIALHRLDERMDRTV